jgi:hypothetical protein
MDPHMPAVDMPSPPVMGNDNTIGAF